ncbi:hypothetical protein D3C78_1368440 [compost metagenome]
MPGDRIAQAQFRAAVAGVPVILPLRTQYRITQLIAHFKLIVAHVLGDIRIIVGASQHVPRLNFHHPVTVLRHQTRIETVPAAGSGVGAAIRIVVITKFDVA